MGLEGVWMRAFALSWLGPVPSACGAGPWACFAGAGGETEVFPFT